MKETSVNHIFSVLNGESKSSNPERVFITTVASSFMKADDVHCIDSPEGDATCEKRIIVAVATEDGMILTKVIL